TANRVAKREQPARECFEAREMPKHACRKAVASHLANPLGPLDRAIDGWDTQLLRVAQKPVPIARRLIATASPESQHPTVALERQHQTTAYPLGRHADRSDTFPISSMVVWDGKDDRRVADIDPDDRFLGLSRTCRLKESRGEIAAPRGVDDQ